MRRYPPWRAMSFGEEKKDFFFKNVVFGSFFFAAFVRPLLGMGYVFFPPPFFPDDPLCPRRLAFFLKREVFSQRTHFIFARVTFVVVDLGPPLPPRPPD